MKYKTNQDLIEIIYNENIEFLDGIILAKNVEELDISAIKIPSLVERYLLDNEKKQYIEDLCKVISSGKPLGPLVVDLDNNLIDGCHRMAACLKLNIQIVPCLRINKILPLSNLD